METINFFLRNYGILTDEKMSPKINQCANDYIKIKGGSSERRKLTGIWKIVIGNVSSTQLS